MLIVRINLESLKTVLFKELCLFSRETNCDKVLAVISIELEILLGISLGPNQDRSWIVPG